METNATKINHYKKLIEQELKTVETELKRVGRINPSNPADWEATPEKNDPEHSDENDVATNIEAFEDNTAILKDLEIRFNELKSALNRIEKGTFGKCEKCGKQIETERLEANPASTTCMLELHK